MAKYNLLLKLLNIAGGAVNPATEEKQDSLIAKFWSSLGQKASVASAPVVLSSEQEAIFDAGRHLRQRLVSPPPFAAGEAQLFADPLFQNDALSTSVLNTFFDQGSLNGAVLSRARQDMSVAAAQAPAYSGPHVYCQRLASTGTPTLNTHVGMSAPTNVRAGRVYTVFARARTAYDTNGAYIGFSTDYQSVGSFGGSQTKGFAKSFVATADAVVNISFSVRVSATMGAGNYFDLMEFRIVERDPSISDVRPGVGDGYMLAHEMGGNPNPVFREDAEGYSAVRGSGTGVDPVITGSRIIDARTGLPCYKATSGVLSTAANRVSIARRSVAAAPGQRVRVSVRFKLLAGNPTSAAIYSASHNDAGGIQTFHDGNALVFGLAVANSVHVVHQDFVVATGSTHFSTQIGLIYPTGTPAQDLFQVEEYRYWIDGVEQRLDEISAKLPATLGQKSSALSLAAVLSAEQEALIGHRRVENGGLSSNQSVQYTDLAGFAYFALRYRGTTSGDLKLDISLRANTYPPTGTGPGNVLLLKGGVLQPVTFQTGSTGTGFTHPVVANEVATLLFPLDAVDVMALTLGGASVAMQFTAVFMRQIPPLDSAIRGNPAATLLDMQASSTAQKVMRLEDHGANGQFSYNVRAPQTTAVDAASHEVLRQRRIGPSSSLTATYSRSGTTVTVTTPSAHNFETGDLAYHSGATDTGLNGYAKVTVTGATTYTFTTAATGAATGAITVKTMGSEFRYRSGVALTGLESGW